MNHRSIKYKLLLITLVSSAVALSLVGAAFLAFEYFSFRESMVTDLSTMSQIVADQSTAALTYNDPATAAENLRAVASKKAGFIAAAIYTNNAVFASFKMPMFKQFELPAHPGADSWRFTHDHLAGFEPIFLNGEQIGTIYICSNLDGLHVMLWRCVTVMLVLMFSSLFAAYLLGSRLQRSLLRSISNLSQIAQAVSAEKNYSVRALKESSDELGQLTDAFNGMLTQIQARDLALHQVNDELEKRVETRTLDLQQQLNRISLLNQITIAVAERQDSESIVLVVLQQLELYLPVDYSSAYWFDPEKRVFKVMVRGTKAWDIVEQYQIQPEIPLSDTEFAPCLEGNTVYLPDLSQCAAPMAHRLSREEDFSSLATPLFLDRKMFGLLVFMRRRLNGFDLAEREFIHNLSTHVALAVRQAQLHQDLQKAYNQLHKTQQAVMQQERLKALGQMASGIAHDINNALSPIVGFAELLLQIEASLSTEGKKYLSYIKASGEDIAHIVAGLKEFYRMRDEHEALAPLNLNRIVEQVVDMTRPRWRDLSQRRRIMIEMRKELASALPVAVGIESEVREALTNLIINAVDAMPTGGTLTVRTRRTETATLLEVGDTGVGMDEQTRKRCLEPFFSTKGKRGTGLGLAMVYGIMERHEGHIEVESEPGKGTLMRLIFPVAKSNQAPVAETKKDAAPGPFRILCIDDEPTVRELVFEMLRHDGHDVVTADGGQSGVQAFQTAQASGKPFDVVITDLGMPHMDGRQVAAALKNEHPRTPVIMLTGWGAFMKEDTTKQIDGILGKPPRIQEIRDMLREVLPENYSKS